MEKISENSLVVVCPLYRDVKSFLQLRDEILARIKPLQKFHRTVFWVVDDSAGFDPDVESLRSLDHVHVVDVPFNVGHQRALVYGLRKLSLHISEETVIVTMDSDGEDKPDDLPRLLAALRAEPIDLQKICRISV